MTVMMVCVLVSPQVWYCIAVLVLLFLWKAVIQRAFEYNRLPTYVVGIDRSDGLWAANIIPGYIVLVLGSLQLAEYDRLGSGGVTASDVFFDTYGLYWKKVRAVVTRSRAMYETTTIDTGDSSQ